MTYSTVERSLEQNFPAFPTLIGSDLYVHLWLKTPLPNGKNWIEHVTLEGFDLDNRFIRVQEESNDFYYINVNEILMIRAV